MVRGPMQLHRQAGPAIKFLGCPNLLTLSEQQYFVWDTASSQSTKYAKTFGGMSPGHAYGLHKPYFRRTEQAW